MGVRSERLRQFFDALIDLFNALWAIAVAPTRLAVRAVVLARFDPPGAAVFVDNIGLASVGRRELGEADSGICHSVRVDGGVAGAKLLWVLLVVVHGENVGLDVDVAAGIVRWAARV